MINSELLGESPYTTPGINSLNEKGRTPIFNIHNDAEDRLITVMKFLLQDEA